jgi:hypothetical protein
MSWGHLRSHLFSCFQSPAFFSTYYYKNVIFYSIPNPSKLPQQFGDLKNISVAHEEDNSCSTQVRPETANISRPQDGALAIPHVVLSR